MAQVQRKSSENAETSTCRSWKKSSLASTQTRSDGLDYGNDIPREMVANSFLKCGITNSLDGSEDDFIFDTSSDDESIVADDSLVTELFNDSESESDSKGF